MVNPPAHDLTGGSDERLPARRPASEPAPGGEALVGHLVDRLAQVEGALRDSGTAAAHAERERGVLGALARRLAEDDAALSDLLRLALPALGDWALVESLVGGQVERVVVAGESARESAAGALTGAGVQHDVATVALHRVTSGGRTQRLDCLPEPERFDDALSVALSALGEGPTLLVPVRARGRLVGVLAVGKVAAGGLYGAEEVRMAEEVASFVALAICQRRGAVEAEDAARAKTEFLTVMSHELRTPLNAIAGYAQLLEMGFRGPLNEAQRESVGRILRAQEHLLELVDAVLTFSRLASGRLLLNPADVPAASLVDLAVDPLRRDFAEREIDLQVTSCDDDARVHADREQAPQVLRHLLGNALKFTDRGGRVTMACEPKGEMLHFVVTDTGRGIPASQRDAIFLPFVQVEKGHTRTVDGTGLGLAIARALAERMGGTLEVTSEVGVGSRFVLALRRARPDSIDSAGGPG